MQPSAAGHLIKRSVSSHHLGVAAFKSVATHAAAAHMLAWLVRLGELSACADFAALARLCGGIASASGCQVPESNA